MKVKLRHEEVFTVGGIRDVDAFDGVLVGERMGDALHFRGIVEWGFHASDVLEVLREARHAPQRLSPFMDLPRMSGAVWLTPRLRAPSWRGLLRT